MEQFRFQSIIVGIDNLFFKTLKIIVDQVLKSYQNAPVEWNDIYYSFLSTVPQIVFNFNETAGLTFKTYLGLKCKFYARTQVKQFVTNRFRNLNEATQLDDNYFVATTLQFFSENSSCEFSIDYSSFSNDELIFFEKRYIKDFRIKLIETQTGWKYSKINKISKTIKAKIRKQLKNLYN